MKSKQTVRSWVDAGDGPPLPACPRVAAFLARYLFSQHVEDRLLPLKQTVRDRLESGTSPGIPPLGSALLGQRSLSACGGRGTARRRLASWRGRSCHRPRAARCDRPGRLCRRRCRRSAAGRHSRLARAPVGDAPASHLHRRSGSPGASAARRGVHTSGSRRGHVRCRRVSSGQLVADHRVR